MLCISYLPLFSLLFLNLSKAYKTTSGKKWATSNTVIVTSLKHPSSEHKLQKNLLQLFYAQNKVVQNGSDSNHLQNSDIVKAFLLLLNQFLNYGFMHTGITM